MVTVVTGPPCAGKTTYVRSHAQPGDIVVDFDLLAVALGSTRGHAHTPGVVHITRAVWWAAVRAALTAHRAWIVDAAPTSARLALYARANAHIVALDAHPAELHRRATLDTRPDATHQAIDTWFRDRQPRPQSQRW